MKSIEFIRLRATPTGLAAVLPQVDELVRGIQSPESSLETYMLKHVLFDGDLAIVMVWNDLPEPKKSLEGLMIAEQLSRIGTVDHAIWVPTTTSHQRKSIGETNVI